MKRMVRALLSLGFSSAFCLLFGLRFEVAFMSAVFSVALTVFGGKWLNTLILWSVVFYILLIPPFMGIFVEFFISANLGYSSYMLAEWLRGNVVFLPGKKVRTGFEVSERVTMLSSASVFIISLFFL